MFDVLKNLKNNSGVELKNVIAEAELTEGKALKKAMLGRTKTATAVFAIAVILGQLVLAYLSIMGSDFVMEEDGKYIAGGVAAFGIFITILAWTGLISGKLKWVFLPIEVIIMTFTAYFATGYFGKTDFKGQYQTELTQLHDYTNEGISNVNEFWTLAESVKANAANIAKIEKSRDGKGVVYQTSEGIATSIEIKKADKIAKPDEVKVLGSLNEYNDAMSGHYSYYNEEYSVIKQTAESAAAIAKGTKSNLDNNLSKLTLSTQQKANLTQLQSLVDQLIDFDFDMEFKYQPKGISDMKIDGGKKKYPYLLEGFLAFLIVFLLLSLSPNEKQLEEARREVEGQLVKQLLNDLKVFVKGDVEVTDELLYALEAILEDDNLIAFVKGKRVEDLLNLEALQNEQESIKKNLDRKNNDFEILNGNNPFKTQEHIDMLRDNGFNNIHEIVEKISPKQFLALNDLCPEHIEEILNLDKSTINSFYLFATKMLKQFGGNREEFEDFMDEFFESVSPSDRELMKIATDLFKKLSKRIKNLNFDVVNHIDPQIADEIINLFTELEDAELKEISKNWKRKNTDLLLEIDERSLFTPDFAEILKRAAQGGNVSLNQLFRSFEEAKKKAKSVSGMAKKVQPELNSKQGFLARLAGTSDDEVFLNLIADVFVVPVIEKKEED